MNAKKVPGTIAVALATMVAFASVFAVSASAAGGYGDAGQPPDAGGPIDDTGGGAANGAETGFGDDYGRLVNREREAIREQHAWRNASGDNSTMHVYRVQQSNRHTRLFHFGIRANDTLALTLDYGVGDGARTHVVRMRAVFLALVEYRDADGDGKYKPGADEVVGNISLSKMDGVDRYGEIEVAERQIGGSSVTVAEVESLDGHFLLRVYASKANASVGRNYLTPKKIKFDFEIRDYPFAENGTRLALVGGLLRYGETHRFTYRYQWDQPGAPGSGVDLNDGDGRRRAYFSWMNEADVDGRNCSVNASIGPVTTRFGVMTGFAFSYEQGALIVHDPDIGAFVYDDDILSEEAVSRILQASIVIFVATAVVATVALLVMAKVGGRRM